MPQQQKHADSAARQRAYRERKRNAEQQKIADKGVTLEEVLRDVPLAAPSVG